MDESVITNICTVATQFVLPPYEVVCYAETKSTHIFVLIKGVCNIGNPNKYVKDNDIICMLEAFYDIPVMKTVICKTYCKFLTVDIKDFRNIIAKYSSLHDELIRFMKK